MHSSYASYYIIQGGLLSHDLTGGKTLMVSNRWAYL